MWAHTACRLWFEWLTFHRHCYACRGILSLPLPLGRVVLVHTLYVMIRDILPVQWKLRSAGAVTPYNCLCWLALSLLGAGWHSCYRVEGGVSGVAHVGWG